MYGLIAGQGVLPGLICDRLGGNVQVFALEGTVVSPKIDPIRFRLETLGSAIAQMQAMGIQKLCLAGGIRRPEIDPNLIDAATRPLVPQISQALAKGDDGALRIVLDLFEKSGFQIVAAHEILPELLPKSGILTSAQLGKSHHADAARAQEIVDTMGAVDIGQACVVAGGQCFAVEAVPGTEWMLRSLSARPKTPIGGLLYKAPKPGQDRRVDLPAIGPDTVQQAVSAGLEGIVVEAGGVMVLDRDAVIRAANSSGLFIWVRERG